MGLPRWRGGFNILLEASKVIWILADIRNPFAFCVKKECLPNAQSSAQSRPCYFLHSVQWTTISILHFSKFPLLLFHSPMPHLPEKNCPPSMFKFYIEITQRNLMLIWSYWFKFSKELLIVSIIAHRGWGTMYHWNLTEVHRFETSRTEREWLTKTMSCQRWTRFLTFLFLSYPILVFHPSMPY